MVSDDFIDDSYIEQSFSYYHNLWLLKNVTKSKEDVLREALETDYFDEYDQTLKIIQMTNLMKKLDMTNLKTLTKKLIVIKKIFIFLKKIRKIHFILQFCLV